MTGDRYLLDANVLIALLVVDHEHHRRVAEWVGRDRDLAVCPISEGALVRFVVRLGMPQTVAVRLLAGLYESSRCEFWPDSVSYVDADLGHVHGYRQVTDAYLASIAFAGGGKLATLDRALAAAVPDSVELIG